MSEVEAEVKEPVEEEVVEPAAEEAPKKPERKEPECNVEVTAASATIQVPLDCGEKPELDVLAGLMSTAKALAVSKARTIIKVTRHAKTTVNEGRPVLDLAAKTVVVRLGFDPQLLEDYVKAAEEAV